MERRAGILLPVFSLPGRFGQGDLGPEAFRLLDGLASAGIRIWQVLPLSPCAYRGSPYASASAFAGNRYLISVDQLAGDGLIDAAPSPVPADDAAEAALRDAALDSAWRRFDSGGAGHLRSAFEAFVSAPEQAPWLEDWALFLAIASEQGGRRWTEWPEPLARRNPEALAAARSRLAREIDRERFVQFLFFRQWAAMHAAAASRGIAIFGDLPIYVAHGSADVWAHPELFELDERGEPLAVSGVPPDYFSKTGQRWGSPLYRWDRCREEGWKWWIDRFRANLRLADLVRIDHFRGFAAYWRIAASEPTAVVGEWRPGPGREIFDAARQALGELPFVAEDLGVITSDVALLRDALGFPGMRVLQFGFAQDDSPHLPHRHVANAVAYTGTHDNDTANGWFARASADERRRAADYTGAGDGGFARALVRAAFESVAETVVAPLQDVLELGSEARLNTPGTVEGNWRWQAPADAFAPERAGWLRRLSAATGRAR
ncbi:MAG TPA: 4-alpha-glucanotransferase [Thermoanaerobaculia bacterium]|nr:4-alpha-glucanotransferase [Thermoanaerobaculia bacterium]